MSELMASISNAQSSFSLAAESRRKEKERAANATYDQHMGDVVILNSLVRHTEGITVGRREAARRGERGTEEGREGVRER